MFRWPPQKGTMAQHISRTFPEPGLNVFTRLCTERGVLSVTRFRYVFQCELWGPAWAVGSYSISQSAGGTSQSIIFKTLRQIRRPALYCLSAILQHFWIPPSVRMSYMEAPKTEDKFCSLLLFAPLKTRSQKVPVDVAKRVYYVVRTSVGPISAIGIFVWNLGRQGRR